MAASRLVAPERVPEGIEGFCTVDAADEPLARSAVADVEDHAVFDRVPEEGELDAVASRNASA